VTLIVSPAAEPTRALVVANLAAAYAEAGLRTHLVTTDDLRSEDGSVPPVGLFQQPTRLGVEEVEAYSTQTQIPGVRRLGMGWLLDGPGQLASTAGDVVAICRQLADVVLVEAPSLLSTYDAEALLPVVDRVLVVGEAGMTTVDQARQTGDLLRRDKAPVVGVVFTNLPPKRQELRAARIRAALSSSPARARARREARASAGVRNRVRRESRTRPPRLARFTDKLRPSARTGPSIRESARQRLQGMFRRARRG
jgi:Mrp family chromosome partitioning ATPase